jgi:hypothetical protein
MAVIQNAQFNPNDSSFQLINISSIDNQLNCAFQCWNNPLCLTAVYQGINQICSLFAVQLGQGQVKIAVTIENTTTISFPNKNITGM